VDSDFYLNFNTGDGKQNIENSIMMHFSYYLKQQKQLKIS